MTEHLDVEVLKAQRDSLRSALIKVLDAREKEAKAWASYETARDNYSGGARLESNRHLRAMLASSEAEREARVLLLTIRDTQ